MNYIFPVILCGGSGTRLWPLSRGNRPKQLISLSGEFTLLEATLLRAKSLAGAVDPICVSAKSYATEVRASLDRLGLGGQLLVEPEPRNTAPALCAAALAAMRIDPGAVVVALPADHVIEGSDAFAMSVSQAVAAAEQNFLAVLGVKPRHASSALGYIVPGGAIDGLPEVYRVSRFTEKPEPAVAASLVECGAFWNAGIVVARAADLIAALGKHEPAVLEAIERSLANGRIGANEALLDQAEFAAAPRISFDKAVLERHERVVVTPLGGSWRDVGTWTEVAELFSPDGDGNRQAGKVRLSSSHNSFVFSPHRLTVGIGLSDMIVVDTPDALLIAAQEDLDSLREVVEEMTAADTPEVLASIREEVAVGRRENSGTERAARALTFTLAVGETRRGKELDAARYWIVRSGSVQFTVGRQSSDLGENQCFHVPPGHSYSIGNVGHVTAHLVEVSTA